MERRPVVLIPLDGSDNSRQALPFARAIADRGAQFVLVQAIPIVYEDFILAYKVQYGGEEAPDARMEVLCRRELEDFADALLCNGVLPARPEVVVEIGDPSEVILEVAQRMHADLIVMSTRGQNVAKRAVLGSVADRVVRHSTVPVCVVHPRQPHVLDDLVRVKRIVITLDGSPLAERAIATGRDLAKQLAAPVLLVRALNFNYYMPSLDGSILIAPDPAHGSAHEAADYLGTLKERLVSEDGLEVETLVEWGTPSEVIEGATLPDDLLVLTSHGRSGVKRWLLGSVADTLIRSSGLPVVIVPVRRDTETMITRTADMAKTGSAVTQSSGIAHKLY